MRSPAERDVARSPSIPPVVAFELQHGIVMLAVFFGAFFAANFARTRPGLNVIALFGFTFITGLFLAPSIFIAQSMATAGQTASTRRPSATPSSSVRSRSAGFHRILRFVHEARLLVPRRRALDGDLGRHRGELPRVLLPLVGARPRRRQRERAPLRGVHSLRHVADPPRRGWRRGRRGALAVSERDQPVPRAPSDSVVAAPRQADPGELPRCCARDGASSLRRERLGPLARSRSGTAARPCGRGERRRRRGISVSGRERNCRPRAPRCRERGVGAREGDLRSAFTSARNARRTPPGFSSETPPLPTRRRRSAILPTSGGAFGAMTARRARFSKRSLPSSASARSSSSSPERGHRRPTSSSSIAIPSMPHGTSPTRFRSCAQHAETSTMRGAPTSAVGATDGGMAPIAPAAPPPPAHWSGAVVSLERAYGASGTETRASMGGGSAETKSSTLATSGASARRRHTQDRGSHPFYVSFAAWISAGRRRLAVFGGAARFTSRRETTRLRRSILSFRFADEARAASVALVSRAPLADCARDDWSTRLEPPCAGGAERKVAPRRADHRAAIGDRHSAAPRHRPGAGNR